MKIKNFLKTAIVFFIGSVLSKLINFFFIPIYTNYFSPEQFGVYDFVNTLINLIAPIAFVQIWDGMFRFAFDYKENRKKEKVINNAIYIFFLCIVVYLVLFSIVYLWLGYDYYGYVLFYGFLFMLQYVYSFSARVYLRNTLFSFTGVIETLVVAVSNIILIIFLNWGIKALYISASLGFLVRILIIENKIYILKNFKRSDKDKHLIVSMLKFSIPLCVATISYWLFSGFTKLYILQFLGEEANGLYAAANRFAYVVTLFVSVFQFAWNEAAYLMSSDGNRANTYRVCVDIMLGGVAFGAAMMCLAIKVVFCHFVGKSFHDAIWLIPPAILGVAANSLASFFATLFMTEKKTGTILSSTFIAIAVNVVLCPLFSYLYGLIGAVSALAAAFFALMLLRLFQLHKKYNLLISFKKSLFLIIVLVMSVSIFYLFNSVLLNIVICFALLLLLFLYMKEYIKMIFKSRNRQM